MIASLVNGKEEEGGLAVLGTRMGRWNFAVILPGHTLSLSIGDGKLQGQCRVAPGRNCCYLLQ
jgi:hypothetical protein